ncbi:hypothetical protein GGQ54_001963 [Naumannella cuiyingiana]|uniref:Uncharacterized protein n=1 Tax=Naumannella cuiyingiana TaxID=1347891 RepID=A0A7Z0ILA5_9ACTN|nr:hypothetical protein [Naumannella cuiyingiana]NYI71403.1 hypothetical protein [Naumannella cuiyingiana]
MTDSQIQAKVAAILSDRELVLNVGTESSVTEGMKFKILNRNGVNIKDPDTGKSLGSVELVKTVVKVVKIEGPHLCIARTFRRTRGTPGALGDLAGLQGLTRSLYGQPSREETFEIKKGSTLNKEISAEESYVKIGDPAIEVTGDAYDDFVG